MIQWLKDQWEEFKCGLILGLGFFWAVGVWCLLLGLLCGILWRLGGKGWLGTKAWRRIGVPTVIALALWSSLGLKAGIAGVISAVLLSIGYGQRSTQPPDPGSPFGNLCLKLAGEVYGKWLARATIIIAIWLVFGGAYLVK